MIKKLSKILNTDIKDLYFSWKTKKCYPKLSEEFSLIKDGTVKMEYGSYITVAGLSPVDDNEFSYNYRLVKKPVLITSRLFLDFNNPERFSIIAHELGHYDFFCNAPSLECLKRRMLWGLVHYYMDSGYFGSLYSDYLVSLSAEGMNTKILDYLSKYVHNDKRKERIKRWNLLKEVYADNKAIDSGYGKALLDVLNNLHEKFGSRISENDVLSERIKNLEEKLKTDVF
ncbi:hypothetical protein FJZ53_01365 [Candidatus Woesearchaeota archaeon]|nr:hypothetical protein [Candidatus Woesearchaeota archaeon]